MARVGPDFAQDPREDLHRGKCVSPKVAPVQRQSINCPGLRIWDWRDIDWQLGVLASRKQIHVGRAPPGPHGLDHLGVERPLRADHLGSAREPVGEYVLNAWDVPRVRAHV